MPKLHFTGGEFDGTVYDLTLERTSVGRSHVNTVVISDRFVSSKHCDILVNGSEVIVRDLGSRNGTLVNGRRLQNQQCAAKSGHMITFGSVRARLEIEFDIDETDLSTKSAVYSHSRAERDRRRAQLKGPVASPRLQLQPAGSSAGDDPKTDIDGTQPQFPLTPVQDLDRRRRRISWKAISLIVAAVGALILLFLAMRFR